MKDSLQKAVDFFGGQTGLAKAIGVKQPYVWNWLNRDKKLPLERAFQIEKATKGEISVAELRPDMFVD